MEVQKHDIVQINDKHKWRGCFVYVTEIKNWGIQGFVEIPLQGRAYIRLKWEHFDKIGTSKLKVDD